jgi:hypothetical protein
MLSNTKWKIRQKLKDQYKRSTIVSRYDLFKQS